MHAQAVLMLRRSEQALSSHLWITLRLCASRRPKLGQSCKLHGWALKAGPNMDTEPLGLDWVAASRHLRKLNFYPITD